MTSLDQYLLAYGNELGRQAQENLHPLHDPLNDKPHAVIKTLLRKPYAPQAHVITAGARALQRQKSLFLCGECGTGKTLMGQAVIHCHANGKPYRAIVMCPGQLVRKWKRELEETIPGCYVQIIKKSADLLPLATYGKPRIPEWYVIGRDTAKLGPGWEPAVVVRKRTFTSMQAGAEGALPVKKTVEQFCCPRCGKPASVRTDKDPVGTLLTME